MSTRRGDDLGRYRRLRRAMHRAWWASRSERVLWSLSVLTPGARSAGRDGPTIREIAAHAGIGRGCVERILLHLSKTGVIEKRYGQPGGVVLRFDKPERAGQADC